MNLFACQEKGTDFKGVIQKLANLLRCVFPTC